MSVTKTAADLKNGPGRDILKKRKNAPARDAAGAKWVKHTEGEKFYGGLF
ncbi:MAG: hypothetical protein IJ418_15100 [Clostridia bacterium]|nr:hypothetical protein [Clostridia bacterium]